MRLPFLRPKPASETVRPAATRANRARQAPVESTGDIAVARARARRRLVGALVLLLVGVIGFPVLFETQPRPLPLDIPIQLPAGEGHSGAPAAPPAPGRPLPVLSVPADDGAEGNGAAPAAPLPATPPAALAAKPAVAAAASVPAETVLEARKAPPAAVVAPASVLAKAPAGKASATPVAAPAAPRPQPAASRPADGARAAALLAGTASAPAAAAEGRFVVQVGAYTDATTLRAARAKVEKLGLKTYTQIIEGDAGKRTRVRLGPYATRAEADAAAAKLKAAGLPGNVLTL